jgi:hypothetical protein
MKESTKTKTAELTNRGAERSVFEKGKDTKTRTKSSMLIALLLVLLTLGAGNAQGANSSPPSLIGKPYGIAHGQTARVNVRNDYVDAIVIGSGFGFLDEDGNLLAEFRGTIEPGKTMSFDLNRDDLIREENRIEIHAVIGIPERRLRDVAISLEVFNNEDGKTTVGGGVWGEKLGTGIWGGGLDGPPVGIALGQTARVNALNYSDHPVIITAVKFLDEEGNLLGEFRERAIEPGKTISFDLNRDDLIREENRIEIHPVIEIPEQHQRGVAISLEVFNNDDGETTVHNGSIDGADYVLWRKCCN